MIYRFKDRQIECGKRPLVMGIINVTPDSFSDSGNNFQLENAISSTKKMIKAGVDIIDVGGESTRPGSTAVSIDEELKRVIPYIHEVRKFSDVIISIDTMKSQVALAALNAGADIINDVTGFQFDPEMKSVAAKTNAGCIVMHMRGTPATMQNSENLIYVDLVNDIKDYFSEIIIQLENAGVVKESIMLDPGVGFSKNVEQNIELVKRFSEFKSLGFPLLLAPSRKKFIGEVTGVETLQERIWGTAAVITCGVINGADVVRVHDVAEMVAVAKMANSLK
ncbi:MAG: dihydropteroate synthase [Lentisphaeria bacterium]